MPKTTITDELYQYAINVGVRPKQILAKLRTETAQFTRSHMQIAIDQGAFMENLARVMNAKKYLEIGVFTGYSSLSMALAMGNDAKIYALDNNLEYLAIAKKFWDEAQVSRQITLMSGEALDSLSQLITTGHANSFDIAFIDADKANYLAYYEYCYQLVRKGGVILIDNVLFYGKVLEENQTGFIKAIQEFNQFLYHDQRVSINLLPIADGLTMAVKI